MLPLVKTFFPPKETLMPLLENVLYSGYVAQGELVENFERAFEKYIGGGKTLSVNSGTSALHIALILAGVKQGDEVISTALTAEPTNVAIKMAGAQVRWADIDYDTGNILPSSILENINEKTKAILVVDYAGNSVNVSEIQKISHKYNIPVIHDCAHSLGSRFDGVNAGNHFPFTVFSFQAIKHLTTIDGGALQIQDQELYEKAKLIRWFGLDKSVSRLDNNIKFQGYKYHMNNVNAAIGISQLDYIENNVNKCIQNGKYLDKRLKNTSGIELLNYYEKSESSFWLYTLKVENRDEFIKMMTSRNIMASELHKRNDLHQFLNDNPTTLPNLDLFYKKLVHLPVGWWVSENDCENMIDGIQRGW